MVRSCAHLNCPHPADPDSWWCSSCRHFEPGGEHADEHPCACVNVSKHYDLLGKVTVRMRRDLRGLFEAHWAVPLPKYR